jgi:hypothetical protein
MQQICSSEASVDVTHIALRYISKDRTLQDFIITKTYNKLKTELNSVALVSERTIPTERPTLAGEVSANNCG